MKNAKKLLLLLLSLVLLIGVFTIAVLADETTEATTATVVYPDGSTDSLNVGDAIAGQEFTTEGDARLYYGDGNTLFKDDATEGWTFTVEGQTEALTEPTVTADMLGKKIIAGGVDKVYYVTEEKISTSAPAVTVYHLVDNVDKYMSSSNTGDRGDGTNTGASSRDVLGNKATQYVKIYLYEDVVTNQFNMIMMPSTRQYVGITTYLDLNGHSVTNNYTGSTTELKGAKLYIFSSKPGANWIQPKTTSSAFYASDDGTPILGNNAENGPYADNISFHTNNLFHGHWGGGAYIYGGHYYMCEGATSSYLAQISRRVYGMKDASFYVNGGTAIFGDPVAHDGSGVVSGHITVTNCNFYSDGTSAILTGALNANLKFENCNFYGIAYNVDSETGVKTLALDAAAGKVSVFTDCMVNDAITYNTVTWFDGTTSYYYATSLEEAKVFVETHPNAKIAPHNVERDGGLYHVFDPIETFTYDEDFNAVVTDSGEQVKIAYTLELGGVFTYITDGSKLNSYLAAMDYGSKIKLWENIEANTSFIGGRQSMEKNSSGGYRAVNTSHWLDLNGYTLTMTTTTSRIESQAPNFYIYSSQPGGTLSVPNAGTAFYTNNGDYKVIDGKVYGNTTQEYKDSSLTQVKPNGSFYFGEETKPTETAAGPYGKNLTVICKAMTGGLYGNTIHIWGGTFVQSEKSTAPIFVNYTNRGVNFWHATFVTTNPSTVHLNLVNGTNRTYKNCNFIYAGDGAVELGAISTVTTSGAADEDAHAKYQYYFTNCNFYNVIPMASYEYDYAHKYVVEKVTQKTYTGTETLVMNYSGTTYYGYSNLMPTVDLDPGEGTQYLAHGTSSVTFTANGKTYVLDGATVTDLSTVLVLTHENAGTEHWMVGAFTPLREAGNSVKIEGGKMYTGAYYNYEAIAEINAETGKILSPGVVTVALAFANEGQAAFTYRDLETGALYGVSVEACGDSETGVFEKFYELFNAPDAGYEIVMYVDMTVTKGMGFGAVVLDRTTDKYNRDYFNSLANGSIIWDLNGTTVTIASDVTGCVRTAAANCDLTASGAGPTYGGTVVFGFEGFNRTNSFTLKSSETGGKIVNLSSKDVFAVGEGKQTQLIIQGENITIDAGKGLVIASHELEYGCNGFTDRHQIYGGTYISSHATGVIKISMNTTIENAILISKNPSALSVVYMDSWRSGRVSANNVTFVAENNTVPIFAMGTGGSGKYTLEIANCTISGAVPTVVTSRITAVTYSGTNKAANPADLATVNSSAPEGTVAAYTSVAVNGEYYKTCAYFAADYGFVTVYNEVAASAEVWTVGATFVASGDVSSLQVVEIDGVWYFRANPVWMGMIDGEAVVDILAAENAGKTVTLTVGGDVAPLYFARKIGDVITYYYGDVDKANSDLIAMLKAMGGTSSLITFYSDFTINSSATITMNLGNSTHKIDLNGYTITLTGPTEGSPFKFSNGSMYIYSSRAGGVMDASTNLYFWMTDSSGNIYLGEPNTSSTEYGKNFTLICKAMNTGRLWSNNGYILGGTYIQPEGTSSSVWLGLDDNGALGAVRNATFIVESLTDSFIRNVCGVYTNCTFIAKNPTTLIKKFTSGNAGATFEGCYFYNMIPTIPEGTNVTFTNCYFDSSVMGAFGTGFVAKTNEADTKTVEGVQYIFDAVYTTSAGLVNWGFGITEYWVIGATATHENEVIDGIFTYAFRPFTVAAENNTVQIALRGIETGVIQMSLTLQSYIGMNVFFGEALQNANITVMVDDEEIDTSKTFITAIAPNVANQAITFTIKIGDNTHTVPLGIDKYAKALINSDTQTAKAKNLTYAMVEYVRAMTGDSEFCNVTAPAGYDSFTLEGAASGNTPNLLTNIRFNLSGTIAIEVAGSEAAEGKAVNLVLATGRSEWGTIVDGSVVFTGLYVNEFFGNMTLTIEGETYTYSLANYLHGIIENGATDNEQAGVQALYNYAYYADAYVAATKPAAAN